MQLTADPEYDVIFNHRGGSYAQAMRDFPRARETEFRSVFRHADPQALLAVADVPAGGGYLRPYIPASTELDAYDPSVLFQEAGNDVLPIDLQRPNLRRVDYDLIVSLASVHHLRDKAAFFRCLAAHCAPQGQIVVADVIAGTKVARFLDDFIGHHNGTGHEGWFLQPADPFEFGRTHPRVRSATVETLQVPWGFADEAGVGRFCSLLFGTRELHQSTMIDALRDYIGITQHEDGVSLHWELTYISALLD